MRSLLFANGELHDGPAVREALNNYDVAYAADGGYEIAKELDVEVTAVIGDLDSIQSEPSCETVMHPKEKEETDLELTIDYALAAGATTCVIIGAMGGRIDHTLANIFLLGKYIDRDITIVSGDETLRLLKPGKHSLSGKIGSTFSLLAFSETAEGITLAGAHYPLENATLSHNEVRGVSNVFARESVTLTFTKGLIYLTTQC